MGLNLEAQAVGAEPSQPQEIQCQFQAIIDMKANTAHDSTQAEVATGEKMPFYEKAQTYRMHMQALNSESLAAQLDHES